jgi:glycosidase
MKNLILTFLLVALLLPGCNRSPKNVAQWPHGVNYEVFVLSFADGDGDGKGDFKGLTQKLDYLKDLGVGGIWLMPIMPSPSYHKYDVTDYKGIHPEYGTEADFKAFVTAAHERGIKVLVDLILNHAGYDHPWFQEAIKSPDNPYRDYFVWAKRDSIRDQISKKETALDSDNIRQWHPVNNDTLAEQYYGYFYGGMPDFNFDNPKVKAEFVDIGRYWLKDMDVDGFRLDAAKHIFPTDRASDNHAFWVWFRTEMQKIKPEVYLVGEVWSPAKEVAPYLKGLPALFNFDMGYAITAAVQAGKDSDGLIRKYKEINDYYNSITNEYVDATFLKNHDQNRILSELNDQVEKQKVAASILMSLPGTPYVYYGEEIGMKGRKPDEYIREPFIWDRGQSDPLQTRWEDPRYSTDQTVVPLAQQVSDPQSLFQFYRKWIHYRNSNTALTYGSLELAPPLPQELVAFYRVYEGQRVLTVHNLSDVEVTVTLPSDVSKIDFSTHANTRLTPEGLVIAAFSSVVLAP